ncbi:MAG: flagellar hook-basal body complex protein FliE [Terracidiphilus sp.]
MQFAIAPLTTGPTAAPNLGAGGRASGLLSPVGSAAEAPAPFSDLLTDAVGQVNQLESQARTAVDGLISGAGVDVHQAMIATQKASMSFELALAVRNKAVQAYQQVIGMQF